MSRACFVLLLALGAAAAPAPEAPLGEGERRAEDRSLRGEQSASDYEDALKKWHAGGADGTATREKAERILRDETSRDVADPVDAERRPRRGEAKQESRPKEDPPEKPPHESSSPPAVSGSAVGALIWAIVILVGALVVAMLLYALTMAVLNARRRPKEKDEEAAESEEDASRGGAAPPVVRDPDAWLADARRHAAAGRWIEALRCLLFSSLERLHRARFIDYRRASTNRECVRAFQGDDARRAPFGRLVDAFDVAVYGQRPFGEAEYARAEQAAMELGRGVGDEGVA